MFYSDNENQHPQLYDVEPELDRYFSEIARLLRENPENVGKILDALNVIIKNAPEYLKLLFPDSPQ